MEETKSKDFILDESGQHKASEQLQSGKLLFGKEGAFDPLLQQLLEAALEEELAAHLSEQGKVSAAAAEEALPNRRNGHTARQLRTNSGTLELSTPWEPVGTFEPELVKKRQTFYLTAWRSAF